MLQTIGLASVPIVLVFMQPDLGTALVYTAALAACLFVAGVRWTHLAVLALLVALVLVERRSGCCRRQASTCSSRTRPSA